MPPPGGIGFLRLEMRAVICFGAIPIGNDVPVERQGIF
jgi:hypothetical protein